MARVIKPKVVNPVNWFEIPVSDVGRAKAFYEVVLGVELTLNSIGPVEMVFFPMADKGEGASGALTKADFYIPSHAGTLVYFKVKDIEATLELINANGGRTLMGKAGIGEYGFIAHFEDCEGNRVALHSME